MLQTNPSLFHTVYGHYVAVGYTTGAEVVITLKIKNISSTTSSAIGGGLDAAWNGGGYSAGGSASFKTALA